MQPSPRVSVLGDGNVEISCGDSDVTISAIHIHELRKDLKRAERESIHAYLHQVGLATTQLTFDLQAEKLERTPFDQFK